MLYDKRWEQKSIELEPWQRILLDAAEIIESCGWCQGDYTRTGSYCALGAIAVATRAVSPHLWSSAGDKAAKHMLLAVVAVGHIAKWNDQPGRTAQEVVAKLREVALLRDAT